MIAPDGEATRGWGIVIGTDTAFCSAPWRWSASHLDPTTVFYLAVTVVDDIAAVTIIGVVYSESIDISALIVAVAGVAVLVALDWGAWRTWPYALVAVVVGGHGRLRTVRLDRRDGRRPAHSRLRTQAGRRAGPPDSALSGSRQWRRSAGRPRTRLARAVPVNERLQLVLHPWTSYVIVPLFALANAGVDLRGGAVRGSVLASDVGVVVGLVAGKFLGIGAAGLGGAALRLGRLPQGAAPARCRRRRPVRHRFHHLALIIGAILRQPGTPGRRRLASYSP